MTLHAVYNRLGSGMTMTTAYLGYLRVLSEEEKKERENEQEKRDRELVEKLAELEHIQWEHWSKDVAKTGLNPERLKRWEGLWIPYEQLPEDMKKFDRLWAWKVLEIMKAKK